MTTLTMIRCPLIMDFWAVWVCSGSVAIGTLAVTDERLSLIVNPKESVR